MEINNNNLYLIAILVGLLLSDGHIKTNKLYPNANYRMCFTFKIWDRENNVDMMPFNIWLKFEILSDICTMKELNLWPKKKPTQCTFNTKNLKLFNEIYHLFYKINNHKIIKMIPSILFLDKYFTEQSLAFLLKRKRILFLSVYSFIPRDWGN